MFKVIRDFVKPQFLVMCDGSCLSHVTTLFHPGETDYEEKQQAQFVNALLAGGWKMTFARQVCPEHVQQEADARLLAMETSTLKN